jgi:hypothetical protein
MVNRIGEAFAIAPPGSEESSREIDRKYRLRSALDWISAIAESPRSNQHIHREAFFHYLEPKTT